VDEIVDALTRAFPAPPTAAAAPVRTDGVRPGHRPPGDHGAAGAALPAPSPIPAYRVSSRIGDRLKSFQIV
jgi:hypothetical protein